MRGTYHPLQGSRSCAELPPVDNTLRAKLEESGVSFGVPHSTVLLSSGYARHWPDGRGIFVSDSFDAFAWVNNEEHLQLFVTDDGSNLSVPFARFLSFFGALEQAVKEKDKTFVYTRRFGFLGSNPGCIGTALHVIISLRVPLLAARGDFRSLLQRLRLEVRFPPGAPDTGTAKQTGVYQIQNAHTLGMTEAGAAELVASGVKSLIEWETALEQGENIDEQLPPPSARLSSSRRSSKALPTEEAGAP